MNKLSKTFIYTVAITIGAGFALILIINQSTEAAAQTINVGSAESISLSSPFKFKTITDFILNIPQILAGFAGIVGMFFFLINGFKYLTGAGNEATTTEAKQGLLYSAIGIALAALTFTIISIAKNLIGS